MIQGTTLRETLLDSEYLTDGPSAYAIGQAASKLEKIQINAENLGVFKLIYYNSVLYGREKAL